ncbi:MAG: hypothetical protein LBR05_10950 [Azoarcus sp.]|jgi:hypothetical protein|nr:hypothetical protein [Azoarcus sp.]
MAAYFPSASPLIAAPARRAGFLALAAVGAAGLALFVAVHPFGWLVATGMAIVLVAACAAQRHVWLVLAPGLMPVVDSTVWSGGFYFAESDALVCAALLVGGWRAATATQPRDGEETASGWRFGALAWVLLLAMLASYALSTQWSAAAEFLARPEWRVGYFSPLNGVRVAKGMLWAALLAPLLADAFRREPAQAGRALVGGALLGLALVSLAAVWERWLFVGLSDFATDYRTTAQFWEMNVGGATLDGWLALTTPFALWLALQPLPPRWRAGALAALAVVAYVCFTTFSRGLYLGLALGGALTVALWARNGWRQERLAIDKRAALGWGLYAALAGVALTTAFRGGGYRGLVAALGLATAVYLVAPATATLTRREWAGAASLALAGAAASVTAAFVLPKGAYLAYAASFVAAGAAWWRVCGEGARPGVPLAATLLWLACNAALVTAWWSEGRGGGAGLLTTVILLAPLAWAAARPQRAWRANAAGAAAVALTLGALTVTAVASGTYYASARFENVSVDLQDRLRHWRAAASLPREPGERWLGIGVGRFAERYFWATPEDSLPGSHQLMRDADGRRYMRLVGPSHALGFGEIYRISQRVSPRLALPLLVTVEARAAAGEAAALHVEACRKHLLYAYWCIDADLGRLPRAWRRFDLTLDGDGLGRAGWPPRPTVFSFGAASHESVIDVASVSVVDARGVELIANGDFFRDGARWFFSSDRYHLPFHAKNLWLHLWVEQGWIGVAAFSLLAFAALWRVCVGNAARHPLAPPLAGALLAFLSVGVFDSLIDAPRLTAFAFLSLLLALGLRPPPRAS